MSTQNKKTDWQQMVERVAAITDKLGMPVDEPIFELVVVLNLLGFTTIGSCGGHEERVTGGPYVDFESTRARSYAEQARAVSPTGETAVEYAHLRKKANYYRALDLKRMLTYLERFYTDKKIDYQHCLIVQSMPMTYNSLQCLGAEAGHALSAKEHVRMMKKNRAEIRDFCKYLRGIYDAE